MLDEIVEKTQERLVEAKNIKSLDELKKEVSQMEISKDFPFGRVCLYLLSSIASP